jgi:outer membrane protein TolC
MRKILLLALGFFLAKSIYGQAALDGYIRHGIVHNEQIKQQEFNLEKSVYALKEAKTLFLPKVSFLTNYFAAGGGRTVDFPAGDLLNPIYNTLNQLMEGNPFPLLANQSILLNPDNFYDTRIRTSAPLFNPEIQYNRNIKDLQVSMQQLEVDLYKRELTKEIKQAYYRYLQSLEAVKIYEFALTLVQENRRVNEVLLKNDMVNATVLLMANREVTLLESQLQSAREETLTAQAYFNFLLNRNLGEEIVAEPVDEQVALLNQMAPDLSRREELLQLQIGQEISQNVLKLNQSNSSPKVSAFLDLGSQGFDWQLDRKTQYYFFGLALEWDLFHFGNNRHKIRQAEFDTKISSSKSQHVQSQLQLQLTTALNQYKAATYQYTARQNTRSAAEKNYNDFLKRYKAGQALYVELLEAQNQYIQSDLQLNVALFDTYIKATEIERIVSGYPINQTK